LPRLPENSRFARRALAVQELLPALRASVLYGAGEDGQPVRLLDSFPMPLCACYRIRQSSLPISGSSFAYHSSKQEYYFGLHPGLLLTESGYSDALFLASGYLADADLLTAYLDACIERGRDVSGQEWIGDQGFVLKQAAKSVLGLTLRIRQRAYKGRLVAFFQPLLDKLSKPIEGVISVLTENFGLEPILVRRDLGLYRRTQAKATAFSLARCFNDVLGIAPMDIARYAV
jgi:hypothetical protein